MNKITVESYLESLAKTEEMERYVNVMYKKINDVTSKVLMDLAPLQWVTKKHEEEYINVSIQRTKETGYEYVKEIEIIKQDYKETAYKLVRGDTDILEEFDSFVDILDGFVKRLNEVETKSSTLKLENLVHTEYMSSLTEEERKDIWSFTEKYTRPIQWVSEELLEYVYNDYSKTGFFVYNGEVNLTQDDFCKFTDMDGVSLLNQLSKVGDLECFKEILTDEVGKYVFNEEQLFCLCGLIEDSLLERIMNELYHFSIRNSIEPGASVNYK